MTPSISPDLLFVLSIVVSGLSNYLRDAGLPRWSNALIAGVAIVLIGAFTAWMSTGFTADPKADVMLVCSILVSLFSGLKELSDLLAYLKASPSPMVPTTARTAILVTPPVPPQQPR